MSPFRRRCQSQPNPKLSPKSNQPTQSGLSGIAIVAFYRRGEVDLNGIKTSLPHFGPCQCEEKIDDSETLQIRNTNESSLVTPYKMQFIIPRSLDLLVAIRAEVSGLG